MRMPINLIASVAVASSISVSSEAFAQPAADMDYPKQTVRIVVPFSAGSATDNLARLLADNLATAWKQSVVVENRPGPVGAGLVARSEPDGYTLMLTSNGHTILNEVNKDLPFHPSKDFSGVTQVASIPQVLIVPPSLGVGSVKEFIELATAKPGALNFASPGLGSATFIAAAAFNNAAKINIAHIPYKGSPEAVTSVIRGDTQLYFLSINLAGELSRSGKVRAIAITTPKRSAALPELPTVEESGLADFKFDAWFGVLAPANTPLPIRQKISADIARVLQSPEIGERLRKDGVDVRVSSPEAFDAVLKEDTVRNRELVRKAIGADK